VSADVSYLTPLSVRWCTFFDYAKCSLMYLI